MITPDNEFKYYHTYQELARKGMCSPLVDDSGHVLTIRANAEGRLELFCPREDTVIKPGALMEFKVVTTVQKYGYEL